MMDLLLATSGGESQSASGGYVDDVFSAYTRTGTGADATVTTGIDMTKGYMLWSKGRSGATDHAIYDSARGVTFDLASNSTSGQTTQVTGLKSVSNTGHTVGSLAKMNTSGATYVDWVFRKAPKFFDIVTYTGNGASNRALSHQLNADVGMIMVKATSTTGDWWVFHRSATGDLVLNTTAAQTASKANIPSATSSTFTVNGSANTNGVQYVAYLFAHDPSAEGIIQCGSFTTDASGNATVNLGWEPQFSMVKAISTTSDWVMLDSMRGWNMSANDATLLANTSGAETVATERGNPTATGFDFKGGAASQTYIYLAIRRPNKPPTSGTEVYNAIARAGTGAAATVTGVGFATDLAITKKRSSTTLTGALFVDRLRGATRWLDSSATTAEIATADTVTGLDSMNGIVLGADATTSAFNTSGHTYISHFFRRAPGFFDVVCYTGNADSFNSRPHNLGVPPELTITKKRSGSGMASDWWVMTPTRYGYLNQANSFKNFTYALGDATSFNPAIDSSSTEYVCYLFASKACISKVGSYTGNGSSQTINCGFATGARFILIKRTDTAGDWYVWDSVRGIIAANDPHLSLNAAAAEVTTDDSVDPEASGFIVNQNTATNINVNGGQYIFLAIA